MTYFEIYCEETRYTCKAWAQDEETALNMAYNLFRDKHPFNPPIISDLRAKPIFTSETSPFCALIDNPRD